MPKKLVGGAGLLLFLAGCSGSGGFGGMGPKLGQSEKDSASKGSSSDEFGADDEQDHVADEPAQVAGAYLTCAYMDSKEDVYNKIRSTSQSANVETASSVETVDVGCGFYNPKTYEKSNTANLQMDWLLHVSDTRKGVLRTRPGAPYFDAILEVPVRYIVSAVEVKASDAFGSSATRRRNIKSISVFGASSRFDARTDLDTKMPNPSDDKGFDLMGLLGELAKINLFKQNESDGNFNGSYQSCTNCSPGGGSHHSAQSNQSAASPGTGGTTTGVSGATDPGTSSASSDSSSTTGGTGSGAVQAGGGTGTGTDPGPGAGGGI